MRKSFKFFCVSFNDIRHSILFRQCFTMRSLSSAFAPPKAQQRFARIVPSWGLVKWIKLLTLSSFIFLAHFSSYPHSSHSHSHSHSHGADSNTSNQDLIEEIYQKAFALSEEALMERDHTVSIPYVRVGGESIPLNSGFFELVAGWIRLYRSELEKYCPCDFKAEELVRTAKEHIAKGFFYTKVAQPPRQVLEHGAAVFSKYTARYGKAAAFMKAAGEVAEDVLYWAILSPGVHVLCNVVDFMSVFLFRKAQLYGRALFHDSGLMGNSRLLMMFRIAWMNRLMKRASRKAFFHLESTEIHREGMTGANQEGMGKNKRAEWALSLSKRITPVLEKIHELEERLSYTRLSEAQRIKLLKKRAKLFRKMEKISQVSQKNFLGKGYKRALWLKSRKGKPDYLRGSGVTDRFAGERLLYSAVIQEEILKKVFMQNSEGEPVRLFSRETPVKKDEIRAGLAGEFAERMKELASSFSPGLSWDKKAVQEVSSGARGEGDVKSKNILPNMAGRFGARGVEKVLVDIDSIFNASLSLKERYLLVFVLEIALTGRFMSYYLDLKQSRLSMLMENERWRDRFKLYLKVNKIVNYVFRYADFLRVAALTDNEEKLRAYKYEAMENVLLFFEHLNRLSWLSRAAPGAPERLFAQLDLNARRLRAFQIHREKKTVFSWIPFRKPVPYCRDLVKSAK